MGQYDKGFTLPPDWADCERGNTYLVSDDGDSRIAWITLAGSLRLEIDIVSDNYPALTVRLVDKTDAELATHILRELGGWYVKKINLNDPRLANLSAGDQIDEVEEDALYFAGQFTRDHPDVKTVYLALVEGEDADGNDEWHIEVETEPRVSVGALFATATDDLVGAREAADEIQSALEVYGIKVVGTREEWEGKGEDEMSPAPDRPNECTSCGRYVADADFSGYHGMCLDCVEDKE